MQNINNESKITRGSSPPFQEPEKWIEDGANGSHWVKIPSANSDRPEDRVKESLDPEPNVEPVRRWEDDGGNSAPLAAQLKNN